MGVFAVAVAVASRGGGGGGERWWEGASAVGKNVHGSATRWLVTSCQKGFVGPFELGSNSRMA